MLAFYLSTIENEKDKRQFEEVYYTYRKQMFLLANSILKNEHDAEDVVHDVFCSVASSHMDKIRNAVKEVDVRNYLLKSVKNTSISLVRKRKTHLEYVEKINKENDEMSDNEFLDKLCNKIEGDILAKAMESMDEKYREVLYYHFVLDLSIAETAKIVDREQNTVRKQLVRAKKILADLISERGK